MSLIPDVTPKPDLFLYLKDPDSNPIDVTNYKIDDLLNLQGQEDRNLTIACLYESSNLSVPIVDTITFGIDGPIFFSISAIFGGRIYTDEVSYNNKLYYGYHQEVG